MTAINVTSVNVLDNPSLFTNPLQFEIQYECLYHLKDDLEWKLIYVGSAESEKYDQVLDSVLVGPVYPGSYRFVFQADPPDPAKLPGDDIVGVTVMLLTCSYRQKEFIRVGYYVNNDYADEEIRENPPERVAIDKLWRNILADKPRVTKFPVEFDPVPEVPGFAGQPALPSDAAAMGGGDQSAAAAAAASADASAAAGYGIAAGMSAGMGYADPAAAAQMYAAQQEQQQMQQMGMAGDMDTDMMC